MKLENWRVGVSIGASGEVLQGSVVSNASEVDVLIVDASNNQIGGSNAGEENVIRGSWGPGVLIAGRSSGNRLEGNGTSLIGNGAEGIRLEGGSGNSIGGLKVSAGNVIAGNGGTGVAVFGGTGQGVLGGVFFSNGGLSIDLGGDGPTPNDLLDADSGPDNLQNYPVLSASVTLAKTAITGTLNSTPSTSFKIALYVSTTAAGPQGRTLLGFANLKTGADGNGSFTFSTAALPAGTQVAAQAFNATSHDSSELAPAVTL